MSTGPVLLGFLALFLVGELIIISYDSQKKLALEEYNRKVEAVQNCSDPPSRAEEPMCEIDLLTQKERDYLLSAITTHKDQWTSINNKTHACRFVTIERADDDNITATNALKECAPPPYAYLKHYIYKIERDPTHAIFLLCCVR